MGIIQPDCLPRIKACAPTDERLAEPAPIVRQWVLGEEVVERRNTAMKSPRRVVVRDGLGDGR
jgi:hypothetical protein